MTVAYDEILDFLTSGPNLEQIVAFEHSPQTLARVQQLVEREAAESMTPEEREELREFRKAEYFFEQLKIRAQRRLERW